jgi:hypothetical protein
MIGQAAASTNRAEAPWFQSCSRLGSLGHGSGHGCRSRQCWVSSECAGMIRQETALQPATIRR